jgi:CubicO group peptidase (beta-lactamase class C family)
MIEGTVDPAFRALRAALDRQIHRYPGGAAIAAYHQGRLVADLWGGARNPEGEPWLRDTMSVSYSTTKGVASTAVHMLADRGLLDYEDPVAKYWPEFGQHGKAGIRIRHILAHEAGLYDVRSLIETPEELLDWDHMVDLLAQARPRHAPGELSAYHAITYGFLTGEIIRRVSGKPFTQFVQDEIAVPLDLKGFFVGVPPAELPNVARLIRPKPRSAPASRPEEKRRVALGSRLLTAGIRGGLRVAGWPHDLTLFRDALLPRGIGRLDFSGPDVLQACIPAANGVFTARDLARFYACLANGGELDGVRLLSKRILDFATRVQSRRNDHVLFFPMRWRLGYHLVGTFRGVSKHAYGHFGYGGSGAWAHPLHNLSFAMIVNSGQGTPMGDLRMVHMSGVALQAVRKLREKPASPNLV